MSLDKDFPDEPCPVDLLLQHTLGMLNQMNASTVGDCSTQELSQIYTNTCLYVRVRELWRVTVRAAGRSELLGHHIHILCSASLCSSPVHGGGRGAARRVL